MSVSIPSFGEREAGRLYVPRPSAYLVIRDAEGRVAAVRTPAGVFLPGGGIEPGESSQHAAEREAREECGFVVRVAGRIGVAEQYVHAAIEDTYFAKRSWFFRAERVGSVHDSEADHQVVWLPREAAEAAMSHGSHAWAIAQDRAGARLTHDDRSVSRVGKTVQVVPWEDRWPELFDEERDRLAAAFGAAATAIHHIGSTGVPGLCGKPVIDILVESPDLAVVDRITPRLEALGYVARGEYGIPGRRYFSRPEGPGPKVHVHTFGSGSPRVGRHLRFRDYLRSHPRWAERYGALKRKLAAEYPNDADAYQSGKASLIEEIDVRATAEHEAALKTMKHHPKYRRDD